MKTRFLDTIPHTVNTLLVVALPLEAIGVALAVTPHVLTLIGVKT